MKQLYIGLLISIMSTSIYAQGGDLEWAKSMGGPSGEEGLSVTADRSGNVYTAGIFNDTADFDPGTDTFNLISQGSNDFFIQKLDASGNFVWAKSIGGAGFFDRAYDIATDVFGNVFVTGGFEDTVDFDPGLMTFNLIADSIGAFVLKLDANGNFKWANPIDGNDLDQGISMITDDFGNVYTTGIYEDTVDFDPSATSFNSISNGAYDIFIQKLDSNGNFEWVKSIGGLSNDFCYSLSFDASGNLYAAGEFGSTVDFDPGSGVFNLTAAALSDIFILKLDANGDFIWAKSIEANTFGFNYAMSTDLFGNVYIAGGYIGTVDFDPGPGIFNLTENGNRDVFILKLDANGNFVWAKSFGGIVVDVANSMTTDPFGNVYTIGDYGGTVDFNPGPRTFNQTAIGDSDFFIQRLDSNGNFVWAKSIGGTNRFDRGFAISSDANGSIYATGQYGNTVDFDLGSTTLNMTAVGGTDVYVLKLNKATGLEETFLKNGLSIYPNPNGGQFTLEAENMPLNSMLFIYNSLGQKVYQTQLQSTQRIFKSTIRFDQRPGIYVVRLLSNDKMFDQKLIVR